MAGQGREVSKASEWVVKVVAKDKLAITCPEGFQDLVGKEIPVEVLDYVVSGALAKDKTLHKGDTYCFTCGMY